jgi:PKD repeat protein
MKFKITTLLFSLLMFTGLSAQPWLKNVPEKMRLDANQNFYTFQKAFNDYWKDKKYERSSGIKPFKRWENFMEPRVYPSGKLPSGQLYHEFLKRKKNKPKNSKTSGNWTHMGPYEVPSGISDDVLVGVGRINAIAFHPTDENIIYIGAPSGGLWKTTDGGETWSTTTDDLPVIGVSDIEVHPVNPDIIFMATGDLDGKDTYSIGLLKSEDAGTTWSTTGLSYEIENEIEIRGILINPLNPDIMLISSYAGIYKSIDGGDSWYQVISLPETGFVDLEYRPGDYSTIYASTIGYSTGGVYRSTDGGESFIQMTNNLPTSDFIRIELAVSPADPDVVYSLWTNNNTALKGVFRSDNSGSTWTEVVSGNEINLLGWAADGSGTRGQGVYDLTMCVSPTDEDEVWVGGINIWKSENGGTDWTLNAHWDAGTVDTEYVHADQHIFIYSPQGILFSGNDGGIYKTLDGINWVDISHGINILQVYRLGTSATDETLLVTGSQDNGSYKCDNGLWSGIKGGDGMECLIDYTNPDIIYATSQFGNLGKSVDGGYNFTNISPASNGAWITPYVIHPTDPNTLWAAYDHVYKTTNAGDDWVPVSGNLAGENFRSLAVAPSNPDYIYVATYNQIFVTTNGGTGWTEISAGLPDLALTYIAVSPDDPENLWITLSGYEAGEKVYTSTNAGAIWTNYSSGLPDIPANCIVYQEGTNDLLYAGTDLGVYYRDNSMTDWLEYNDGLPNVIVDELEIHYGTQRIRAATYGRGVWESHLYDDGTNPPFASFATNKSTACGEEIINFTDRSAYSPTTWEWTFSPSTVTYMNGTDQFSQNPEVQFNEAGSYTVTLDVTNSNGSQSLIKTDYILQTAIIADFRASKTLTYPGSTVYLYDQSVCDPTSRLWEISPSSYTFVEATDENSQNPVIVFNEAGEYTVSLTVSNALGSETLTETDYISVGNNYFMENVNIYTCEGYFYDSQGPDNNYRDSENFVITFLPDETDMALQFNFRAFNVEFHESCNYDYLAIYDGTSEDADLIGIYCGTNSPGIVTADNIEGALTFMFHADGGVRESGWTAEISCVENNPVPRIITEEDMYIYPNPNNGMFRIQIQEMNSRDIQIDVISLEGKLIRSEYFTIPEDEFEMEIDLKVNARGVYMIKIITEDKVLNGKCIIE